MVIPFSILIRRWAGLSLAFLLLACARGQITSTTEYEDEPVTAPTGGTRILLGYMNFASKTAAIFSADEASGILAPHADSPLSTGTGGTGYRPSVSKDGKCWFIHTDLNGFYGFRYTSKFNTFTPLLGNPFLNNNTETVLTAVDPNRRFLYTIRAGVITTFTLDDNCNPTQVSTYNRAGATRLVVDGFGQYLYVMTTSRIIYRYDIQSNGTLSVGSSLSLTLGASAQTYDLIDVAGKFLYVSSQDSNEVECLQIGAFGDLTSAGRFSTSAGPSTISANQEGTLLVSANSVAGTLSVFSINASTGTLTQSPGSPFSIGSSPQSASILPGRGLIYVAFQRASNNLQAYSLNTTTGAINTSAVQNYTMTSATGGLISQKISY